MTQYVMERCMPKKTILITMSAIVALCVIAQVVALNDTNTGLANDSKLQQFSKEVSNL
jgi:hypothetical protein